MDGTAVDSICDGPADGLRSITVALESSVLEKDNDLSFSYGRSHSRNQLIPGPLTLPHREFMSEGSTYSSVDLASL
jgi:hypothetical protein